MNEALNNPVRRARKEVTTDDMPMGQQDPIDMAFDSPLYGIKDIEPVDPEVLQKDFAEALAFSEEPIEVELQTRQDKNPPLVVDCWVQGKGAEVWVNGWHELGCLPFNRRVVTKRKYIEALLMSKQTSYTTEVGDTSTETPHNIAVPHTTGRVSIAVTHDRNPKGREWLLRLMALKN